jgi:hypothetical protein
MSDRTPPDEPAEHQEPVQQPEPPAAPSVPTMPAPGVTVPGPPPAKRRGLSAIVIGVIVVAVVLVGGAAAAFFSLRGAPETVLDKVPATADVVMVAHLNPSASQKMNLFRMAERFPALGSHEQITHRIDELLDDTLADQGLHHEDLAWVGGEAGAYVDLHGGTASYAILLASDDDGSATAMLDKLESTHAYTSTQIDGVEVNVASRSDQPTTAIVNGVVVLASDQTAAKAVIETAHGTTPSIQTDGTYSAVADDLPEDNLGMVYVNVASLNELLTSLVPGGGLTSSTQQFGAARAVGVALSATSDGLRLDTVTQNDPSKLTQADRDQLAASDGPNPLLQMVPADAYAVLAANGVTTNLQRSVEQMTQLDPELAHEIEELDLLGPNGLLEQLSGNVAVQVGQGQGLLPVGATAMIGVKDADAVEGWLNAHLPKLLPYLDLGRIQWRTEDYQGTTIHYTDPFSGEVPIAWGVTDQAVVIGLSVNSVEQAVDLAAGGSNITSNPTYRMAIAKLPGTESVLYLDVAGFLSTVEGILPGDAYQRFLDEGGENLKPITVVVAGTESDEQGSRSTFLIEIP